MATSAVASIATKFGRLSRSSVGRIGPIEQGFRLAIGCADATCAVVR